MEGVQDNYMGTNFKLKKEQPDIVKEYMRKINKKTVEKTGATTPKKRKNKRMSTSLH